jgi:hypothetical protein
VLLRLLLPCLCTFALVTPAAAQDPQVDPGSPAGTEYQLPVERAREEAGGGSSGSSGSGGGSNGSDSGTPGEAPLFGAGVEGEKQSSANAKSGTDSDPATTADVEQDGGTSAEQTVRAQAPAPDDAGAAIVAIAGGAAGVLLLGGLAGLAWRRRSSAP